MARADLQPERYMAGLNRKFTPWDDPTTIGAFTTAAEVKAWIAEHRRRALCEQAELASMEPRSRLSTRR